MSKTFLPLLADRCLNRPLLIDPGKADQIMAVLEGRFGLSQLEDDLSPEPSSPLSPEASRFRGTHDMRRASGEFVRAEGRTALITIDGSLVNRGAWLNSRSGLTSYEGLAAQIDAAVADAAISAIVLDINSPGGEATGMFALAAKIRSARSTRKVVAVVNDIAASAAYGLAAQADQVVISSTSMVGSIGVVMLHLDRSGELASKGVRPTLIHAGAHKVDGNSFGPLPEGVRAAMQRDVMAFYDRFLETVEAGRGRRLSAAKARKTEAQTYIGKDAISAGLADRLGSLDEVLAELHSAASTGRAASVQTRKGKIPMDNSYDEGIARQARAAERQRISAIVNSPAANGRAAAALRLALESDMSAEAASGLLGTFPAEAAEATAAVALAARQQGRQEIGASGRGEATPEAKAVAAEGWKAAFAGTAAKPAIKVS